MAAEYMRSVRGAYKPTPSFRLSGRMYEALSVCWGRARDGWKSLFPIP